MIPMESTYQGYISSTHDALLVFECVRRGIMPKIRRRMREEERRLIRSGQVFVFDEKESGIKRWTDGLVWSPSRILWNFLVYRQVDKKFGGRLGTAQQQSETSPKSVEIALQSGGDSANESDPYAMGVEALSGNHTSVSQMAGSGLPSNLYGSSEGVDQETARIRSNSLASDHFSNWLATDLSAGETIKPGSLPSHRVIEEERSLVGSLKSSYPFAKGGLCKKTISIQVNGSTQHLISYYSVEDVRSGRLRTPSSLPEIASLCISPILLTKTSFRFPPTVQVGPDGIPRFRGEDGFKVEGGSMQAESSGEGNSSGSDYQYRAFHGNSMQSNNYPLQPTFTTALAPASSSSMDNIRLAPMSHQIGGSGAYKPGQKMPGGTSRKTRKRFDPYHRETSTKSHASGDDSSVSTSPTSSPTTPFFAPTMSDMSGRHEATNDTMNSMNPLNNRSHHQTGQAHVNYQGSFNQEHTGTDNRLLVTGMALGGDEGPDPYQDEEDARRKMLEELLAEQLATQRHQEQWNATDAQQEQLRQRVLGDAVHGEGSWTRSDEATLMNKSAAASHFEEGHPHAANSNARQGLPRPGPSSHCEAWSGSIIGAQYLQPTLQQQQQQQQYHNQSVYSASMVHPLSASSQHVEPIRHETFQHSSHQDWINDQSSIQSPNPHSFMMNMPTDTARTSLSHPSQTNRSTSATPYWSPEKSHVLSMRPARHKPVEDRLQYYNQTSQQRR